MIRFAKALLLVGSAGCMLFAQNAQTPPATTNAPDDKSGAYYNFAMGRLYMVMAETQGNKDYVSKAIQYYQEALKLDPSAGIIFEELTDLYIQTGRLRDALNQAEDMLKQNPDNLDARRMLGRIYTRSVGDPQSGKIDEGKLKLAIEQYQKVTEKDPKDAESWVMLGRLYMFSTNSLEAEKAFNAALAAEPDNEDAITQLAVLYAELGDSKRAIEKLKVATSKNPNERMLTLLAEQYEQLRDFKSAAEILKKALEMAPDNGKIVRGLAQDLAADRQFDEALKIWEQIAAEEPKDPQAPLSISEIYRLKRDFPKAHAALGKAKALDNESLDVRYQEVQLAKDEGKTDEAIAALKSMLDDTARKTYSEIDGRRRAAYLEEYGILSRSIEKYAQALDAFKQMAALGPEAAKESAVQTIETYVQSKDLDAAMREADAAVKKYPDERAVRAEHATVLAERGKIDDAVAEIRSLSKGEHDRETQLTMAQLYEKGKRFPEMGKALDEAETLSKSDEERVGVFFMRGAMYERMKKYDASEAAFRKVLELDPENAGTLNYLGYMLADRGVRLDEAYQMIKKAVDLDPNNGAYLDSLGWVYFRQGKLQEAQDQLQMAIDKMATDPTVHDHLGDVYFKLGKTREAIAQWQASLKASQGALPSNSDPEEVAKVNKKLDEARVRLAQENHKK